MKVAISGLAGSGKTALARALYERLKGEIAELFLYTPTFKDTVKALGLTLEEYEERARSDFSIDRAFDDHTKKVVSTHDNVIVSSWLAIWVNDDVDLKVFLHAPIDVRVARIIERDGINKERAKAYVLDRDYRNAARYRAVYGIDIFKPWNTADIIINTAELTLEEETSLIEGALKASISFKKASIEGGET